MIRRCRCAAALAAVSVTGASAQGASDDKVKVTLVYDQVLPNVPGKSIRGVLATEPARLLAVFVVDTNETTLTTPYKK
jgi:hypothetical protein